MASKSRASTYGGSMPPYRSYLPVLWWLKDIYNFIFETMQNSSPVHAMSTTLLNAALIQDHANYKHALHANPTLLRRSATTLSVQ